jgi:hypothetical protein
MHRELAPTRGSSQQPNPGSETAVAMGCTCPVIDNHYGRGVPNHLNGPLYWIAEGCPLHDTAKKGTAE